MALIPIRVDITGTPLDDLFRRGGTTANCLLNKVIEEYKPTELQGYTNFRTSNYSIGGRSACILEAVVRCRKLKGTNHGSINQVQTTSP